MTDIAPSRECGECTACCEGWLTGEIRGHKMMPGKNCHFLGCNRCTIYEERPQDPCRNFECGWLQNKNNIVPEWMKPSKSKVMIKEMKYEVSMVQDWGGRATYIMPTDTNLVTTVRYWNVVECGETISGPVLNWLVQTCLLYDIPMIYEVAGKKEVLGPPEFHVWCEQSKKRQSQMTK